jgi:hypothetical protein
VATCSCFECMLNVIMSNCYISAIHHMLMFMEIGCAQVRVCGKFDGMREAK